MTNSVCHMVALCTCMSGECVEWMEVPLGRKESGEEKKLVGVPLELDES